MRFGFWQAALLGAAVTTVATLGVADGLSDATFGQAGVAKIAFPGSTDGGVQAAATVNGSIDLAGFSPEPNNLIGALNPPPPLFIAQVSLAGVPSAIQMVRQQAIQNPTGLIVRSDGNIFAVGANFDPNGEEHATVVWFDSSGRVIASYQRPASGIDDQSACLSANRKLLLDTRGNVLAACIHGDLSHDQESPFALEIVRLIPQNGSLLLDSTFGTNGWQEIPLPAGYGPGSGFGMVFEDPLSGDYYFGGRDAVGTNTPTPFLMRLDAITGAPDMTFGVSGYAMAPVDGESVAFAIDGSGRVILAGIRSGTGIGCCGQTNGDSFIARFNTDGSVDSTFGNGGFVTAQWLGPIVDALADTAGRIYLQASQLSRLTVTGDRDSNFSSSSDVQTINGAGSAWASMLFADSAHSAIFLLGGAFAAKSATTAVIQKITLAGGPPVSSSQTMLAASFNQTALSLTATVTGDHPTGGVTFFDGLGVIGTAPLSNGSTALSVAVDVAGTYNFTAYYGGDASNGFSNSSVVPITVTVTSGPAPGGTTNVGAIHISGGGEISSSEIVALLLLILAGRFRLRNTQSSRPITSHSPRGKKE